MAESGQSFLVACPACGTTNRVPASREGVAGRCGRCRGVLPPLYFQPVPLTDRSFDPFFAGYHGPVLVEFWAPW